MCGTNPGWITLVCSSVRALSGNRPAFRKLFCSLSGYRAELRRVVNAVRSSTWSIWWLIPGRTRFLWQKVSRFGLSKLWGSEKAQLDHFIQWKMIGVYKKDKLDSFGVSHFLKMLSTHQLRSEQKSLHWTFQFGMTASRDKSLIRRLLSVHISHPEKWCYCAF
jgi:hypothetical protein